jgi:hypothetical protein
MEECLAQIRRELEALSTACFEANHQFAISEAELAAIFGQPPNPAGWATEVQALFKCFRYCWFNGFTVLSFPEVKPDNNPNLFRLS